MQLLQLGTKDSNLRMPESESGALPLGECPILSREQKTLYQISFPLSTVFKRKIRYNFLYRKTTDHFIKHIKIGVTMI